MMCVGGDHDGVSVTDVTAELPCPYQERQWKNCEDATATSAAHQFARYTFGLMLPLALRVIV